MVEEPIPQDTKPDTTILGEIDFNEQSRNVKARRHFMQVWTLVGAIGITAVIIYLLGILSTPVGIIIWTAIIVFVLRTPVNWLERKGVNRAIGTAIAYIMMFVVLACLGLLLFSPVFGVGEQFQSLIQSIPGYVQEITTWYNEMYAHYSHIFQNDTVRSWLEQAVAMLSSVASNTAKLSAEGIVSVGGGIANTFLAIGFALVVAFWILMDLPRLGKECMRLVGEKRQKDAQMIYVTVTRVMGGYIKATLIQCFLIGLGCGIAFSIIGLPNSAALGGIAGILNIIPVVGPWFGGLVAALVGVFVSPLAAIIAVVATIAIQQFVYTFISPKIMADSVNVHPALVFIALFAGGALGGAMSGLMGTLMGMLASIPAVAAAKAIFVYYFEKKTGRSLLNEEGVFFKGNPADIEGLAADPLADIAALGQAAHETEQKKAKKSFPFAHWFVGDRQKKSKNQAGVQEPDQPEEVSAEAGKSDSESDAE